MIRETAIDFSEVVHLAHGLPLSTRSVEEILEDCAIQEEFSESLKASMARRKPPAPIPEQTHELHSLGHVLMLAEIAQTRVC